MNNHPMRIVLATALLALAACQPGGKDTAAAPNGPAAQALAEAGKGVDEARKEIEQARQKLASENFSLGRDGHGNLPKAEITPDGEVLVAGRNVTSTPEQKALGLAYRTQLQDVVSDGMAIGIEGAKLGIDAAGAALKSLFDGQSADEIGKQAEVAARERIKPQVEQLCARLPRLMEAQQALAAALPEFRPYATMDQSDIDDCADKGDWNF